MTDHSKDNPLENPPLDHEDSESNDLFHQDGDEDHFNFDRTIKLDGSFATEPGQENPDSDIQSYSMESLFEKESTKASATKDQLNESATPEATRAPAKPDDDSYDLGINTGELGNPQDFMMEHDIKEDEATVVLADLPDEENESHDVDSLIKGIKEQVENPENSLHNGRNAGATSVKKIELTEADYASKDTATADAPDHKNMEQSTKSTTESSEKKTQVGDEASGKAMNPVNEPEDVIDSQVIAAAAKEAHALQDKPETPDKDKNEAASSDNSTIPSVPAPRTGLATILALIGIIGASGALWMNLNLSERMDQLESKLATMQADTVAMNQRADISALSQRVDELNVQLGTHLKNIAQKTDNQNKEGSSAPGKKESVAAGTIATKPTVTAVVPTTRSRQGKWVVNLTSFGNASAANKEIKRLKRLGIHAERAKAIIRGKTWYRIRVPGFASRETAEQQRKVLGSKLGIRDTWIGKR